MRFDLLIKGGVTIDDAGGVSGRHDVAVTAAASPPSSPASRRTQLPVIDATDLL